MKIVSVGSSEHRFALKPYATSYGTVSEVTVFLVELTAEDGSIGLGSASPATYVTGETLEHTRAALAPDALAWLNGRDVVLRPTLCREAAARLAELPAARTAVDGALFDLWAQTLGRPLVDLLGRVHEALPTAITIGIKPVEETLDEIDRRRAEGFRVIKVKVGRAAEEDAARLRRVRGHVGPDVR